MQPWLKQNGHHNIFTLFSEEQCQELLHRLEHQLVTEEQLEQAAREVVAFSARTHTVSEPAPEGERLHNHSPIPKVCNPNPASHTFFQRTATRIGLGASAISLALLSVLFLWSFGLYRYAYRQGMQSPNITAAACNQATTPGSPALACASAPCNAGSVSQVKTSFPPLLPLSPSPSERPRQALWSQGLSLPAPFATGNNLVSFHSLSWKTPTAPSFGLHETKQPPLRNHTPWSDLWQQPTSLLSSDENLQLDLHQKSQHSEQIRFVLLQPLKISN